MSENDLLTLVRELAEALADHHAGLDTTRPFRETYERDAALLNRAWAVLDDEAERLLEESET